MIFKENITVGFTYDLKDDYLAMGFTPEQAAEFDNPETIDGIFNTISELGFTVDKIGNVKSLINRLVQGDRWDIVFNICEGVSGVGREAQVPAVLDVYNIPYVFSDVLVLSLTLHKGLTKQIIRDCGIPTAAFFVVNHADDIKGHDLIYPLFVKPVAEGTGKGIAPDSIVNNKNELARVTKDRLERFGQSLIVEEFLPGREFTVGIVGTGKEARVIGMMEVIYKANESSGIYSYTNKAHYEKFIEYMLPDADAYEKCSKVALDAWKALDCRDGGRVDLRMNAGGVPHFIEVNPLAGLNPIHSDLPILARKSGISYRELLQMIMQSALQRLNLSFNIENGIFKNHQS
jgi:D-alanine-D-alanine ligase